MTGEHKSYQNINALTGYNFKKASVNHSKGIFVNNETGATTNSIESNWNILKLDVKKECGWRTTNINENFSYLQFLSNLDKNFPEIDLLFKLNQSFPASCIVGDNNGENISKFLLW